MVVAGIGNSPLYALGVPYMDQNVKAKVSPMYLGIFVGFGGILGKTYLHGLFQSDVRFCSRGFHKDVARKHDVVL